MIFMKPRKNNIKNKMTVKLLKKIKRKFNNKMTQGHHHT